MTLGGWIGFGVVMLILWGIGGIILLFIDDAVPHGKFITVAVLSVTSIAILVGNLWYFNSTEDGQRAFKTQESNFNGGIEREVKVYSMDGKLIESYHGNFDIEYDDDRILFDDENGQRHIIYYPTGTVLIDEVSQTSEP